MVTGSADGGFRHDRPGRLAPEWTSRAAWAAVPPLDLLSVTRPDRVVVCAAHPDDETLGAGGLIWLLHHAGIPVSLLLATDGERSHPHSTTTSAKDLAARRRDEALRAWRILGGTSADVAFWGLPDGGLTAAEEDLTTRLVEELDDARRTLLITPWHLDGHPDHDAMGRAGRTAAYRTGARLLQYPVWFWHRADPDAPWPTFGRIPLAADSRAAKAQAVASHASQVAPLSTLAGDETLLSAEFLEHFAGTDELFVVDAPADDALDLLHGEHEDPWGTERRWYEQRKRDLVLTMLPRRSYERALDVGCSTGTLTQALASRCRQLVAIDRSPQALVAARERLQASPGVEVRQLDAPTEWPEGTFDLIVVSESGYFLSPAALEALVERTARSLAPGGCLLLAHWRHQIRGWPRSGPDVHAAFRAAPTLPMVIARYEDRDVQIVVHANSENLPNPGADE